MQFVLFKTLDNHYIYSGATNKLMHLSKREYDELNQIDNLKNPSETFQKFSKSGIISRPDNFIIRHPASKNLDYYLNFEVNHLLLQVTQRCNLRCSYCVYSESYSNRKAQYSLG